MEHIPSRRRRRKHIIPELSTNERQSLPDWQFGLPHKRAYPMPDVSHARVAKARASEEYHKGVLTTAEWAMIDRKADEILQSQS